MDDGYGWGDCLQWIEEVPFMAVKIYSRAIWSSLMIRDEAYVGPKVAAPVVLFYFLFHSIYKSGRSL